MIVFDRLQETSCQVDDIFLSRWQGYRCSGVCALNYILGDAAEKVVGNTDDFSLCQRGPLINTD